MEERGGRGSKVGEEGERRGGGERRGEEEERGGGGVKRERGGGGGGKGGMGDRKEEKDAEKRDGTRFCSVCKCKIEKPLTSDEFF